MATLFPPLSTSTFVVFLLALHSFLAVSRPQPLLSAAEQEAVFQVLDSINSAIPWRTLFPDDLCSSAPHGVVCEFFYESSDSKQPDSAHITELSFGYVSDYSPNPPCSPNSTLNPALFTSFKFLRKLFFYKCFTETRVLIPEDVSPSFSSSLEELVFIDNPALVGSLGGLLGNFTSLTRAVLNGNGVYGALPSTVSDLVNLEEITLSGNQLSGQVSVDFARLKSLKVLDLSRNYFAGSAPESAGNLSSLLKLDLSSNGFCGRIPESFGKLKNLEFLDLSFNRFGNFGIPSFLSELPRLREVHLSGNLLGGQIPRKWENASGISGIGFSGMGLVGGIPASMGLYLRNLSYLALDNNKLQGTIPRELAFLDSAREIHLENNSLSGRIPFSAEFSARIGEKLGLEGNPELCVAEAFTETKNGGSMWNLSICNKPDIPNPVVLSGSSSPLVLNFLHVLALFELFAFGLTL